MESAEALFVGILGIFVGGGIGALIGRNRKIGAGWSFLLGAIFGIIGWIIAACSERTNITKFDDMSRNGGIQ